LPLWRSCLSVESYEPLYWLQSALYAEQVLAG
jgi:hypothetical protein